MIRAMIAAVGLIAGGAAWAAAQSGYKLPPPEVVKILDAPPTPTVSVSPTRDAFALVEAEGYPPIRQLARPILRLAGVRIDPGMGAQQRLTRDTGITIDSVDGKRRTAIKLPEGARVGAPTWSPDGSKLAFARDLEDGVELWVADSRTGQGRAIPGLRLVDILARPFAWVDGGRTLLVHRVPPARGPAPPAPDAPSGPNIEETAGRVAQVATYQDLLKSPRDEELFAHYATSQLARVDAEAGTVAPVGEAGLIAGAEPSPDGKYLLVTTLKPPFSYRVPYPSFARTVSVLDAGGKLVRTIADLPISDDTPRQGSRAAPGRSTGSPWSTPGSSRPRPSTAATRPASTGPTSTSRTARPPAGADRPEGGRTIGNNDGPGRRSIFDSPGGTPYNEGRRGGPACEPPRPLLLFRDGIPSMDGRKTLTTADGMPVGDNQNSLTAGPRGPLLMQDFHLLEKMAHFNRERIPERVVHAKGAGAFGRFTVTRDISKYTRAKLFSEVGKSVEMLARFSTVGGEKGSADTERDPRGFALKFYTEEGNWDLVGNNTPIFFIRDPLKFGDFIHTQKRDPRTNLKSPTMMWDFWSLSPESLHQVTILFGDRGTPDGFRHMHGFGSHTFSMINAGGERFWVKFHMLTQQGIKNFTREEAGKIKGEDPDYATRDLFESIERGEFPRWTMSIQVMPEADAAKTSYNPFDLTKVWPHSEYPLIEVGTIELNRNPENYFAEIESAAFSPNAIVPGISFSPDKMLQARVMSYADAHRYRLGVNYQHFAVNAPKCPMATYQRDGAAAGFRPDNNGGRSPNYEPNSFGGPAEDPSYREPAQDLGQVACDRFNHRDGNDDHGQAGDLFRLMNRDEQGRLIGNIVDSMQHVSREIQLRQICHFFRADPAYGMGVAMGLGMDMSSMAGMVPQMAHA